MISMSYRYANMLNRCAEDHTRLWNTFFFPARSFFKKLLMAFLSAQLRAIYVKCVYFYQLYSQISPQSKISLQTSTKHNVFSPESTLVTTSVMRKRCSCKIQNGSTHKTVPKTSFFQFDNDIAIWYWHQLYRYWHRQKCLLGDITSWSMLLLHELYQSGMIYQRR